MASVDQRECSLFNERFAGSVAAPGRDRRYLLKRRPAHRIKVL
jgi:hypothetical protein